jgi:uncharacterized coiled-coil DUF342 family protein
MVQSTPERFLTNMEREIQAEVQSRPAFNEHRAANLIRPMVQAPTTIPEYVEHRDGATEIGKLSAEAVVREYEAAAKEIESMGAQVVERVKQCETMMGEALAVTDELKEVAERYRKEAKRVFDQIESCSLVVAEARKTCTELRDKIAASPAIDGQKQKKK